MDTAQIGVSMLQSKAKYIRIGSKLFGVLFVRELLFAETNYLYLIKANRLKSVTTIYTNSDVWFKCIVMYMYSLCIYGATEC